MRALLGDAPTVIVVRLHIPAAVIVSAFLLPVGVALAVLSAARFRRTSRRVWILLSVAAAAVAVVALVGLVLYFVRSLP